MSLVRAREDRTAVGVGLMLCAYVGFTGIDSSAKWLIQREGLPALEVVFVRYAAHLAIVLALFAPGQGLRLIRTGRPGLETLRGAMLLGSTLLNFTAVAYLPLTLTSAIMFTTPLWVCALSIPLLGERVGPRRWAAIIVGFCGVLVAVRPWEATAHWAAALSLGAACCAGLYAILTRRLAGVDSTDTQQVWAAGVATLATAPLALGAWAWPASPEGWFAFAAIGVFGWGGHQALTVAHRFAPASLLAPLGYSQLLWMSASSWLIFAQPPTAWVLAGAAIVLASGLYIWLRERQLARPAAGRAA